VLMRQLPGELLTRVCRRRTGPVATQQDLPGFDLLDPGEFVKRSMSEVHVERKRLMAACKSAMDGTRFPLDGAW
jgi:hypothetical protein